MYFREWKSSGSGAVPRNCLHFVQNLRKPEKGKTDNWPLRYGDETGEKPAAKIQS